MKIVVSLNRKPGEPLPTPRQIRLALGQLTAEAMALLKQWSAAKWMTIVRDGESKD